MVQMEERNKDIMTKKKKSASKNPFLREQKQIFKYLSSEFPSQMKNIMVYPAYLHTAPNRSKTDVRLERTAPILPYKTRTFLSRVNGPNYHFLVEFY